MALLMTSPSPSTLHLNGKGSSECLTVEKRHRIQSTTSEASTITPTTPYFEPQTASDRELDNDVSEANLNDSGGTFTCGDLTGGAGTSEPITVQIEAPTESWTDQTLSPTSLQIKKSLDEEPPTPTIFANFAESSFSSSQPFQGLEQTSALSRRNLSSRQPLQTLPVDSSQAAVKCTTQDGAKTIRDGHRTSLPSTATNPSRYSWVRALHDFVPATLDSQGHQENIDSCLSFSAGCLIRVLSRDSSGWWDGEYDGKRGWFPSNYVVGCPEQSTRTPDKENLSPSSDRTKRPIAMSRTMTTPYPASSSSTLKSVALERRSLSNSEKTESALSREEHGLLGSLREALATLRDSAEGKKSSQFQPNTARIIAAIRAILAAHHCLSRDSRVLQSNSELLRARKSILTELSRLVAHAKKASSSASTEGDIRPMLESADQVMNDVVGFMGTAQNGQDLVSSSKGDLLPKSSQVPSVNTEPFRSRGDGKFHPQSPQTSVFPAAITQTLASRRMSNSSYATSTTTDVEDSYAGMSRCISTSSATSAASRESSDVLDAGSQVTRKYDHLLSTIAAFIGHVHNHTRASHPSSFAYLIDLTRTAVDEVRALLQVVEAVGRYEKLQSMPAKKNDLAKLALAREALYASTTALVSSARVATSSVNMEKRVLLSETEEQEHLLAAATQVLRAAGECMFAVKDCIVISQNEQLFILLQPADNGVHARYVDGSGSKLLARSRSDKEHGRTLPKGSVDAEDRFYPSLSEKDLTSDVRNSSSALSALSEQTVTALPTSPTQSTLMAIASTPAGLPIQTQMDSLVSEPMTPTSSHASDYTRLSTDSTQSAHYTSNTSASAHSSLTSVKIGAHHQTSFLDNALGYEYQEGDITFNSEGQVTGGTLAALVERLTLHDQSIDPTFSHTFFLTFRLFTTPVEFAQALINRYMISMPSNLPSEFLETWKAKKLVPLRLRVYNVLKTWLEFRWQSETDNAALGLISDFAEHVISDFMPQASLRLLEFTQKKLDAVKTSQESTPAAGEPMFDIKNKSRKSSVNLRNSSQDAFSMAALAAVVATPTPVISKSLFSNLRTKALKDIPLTEFDPLELARQFTLIESALYCAIRPTDLIGVTSSARSGAGETAVRKMSALSTRITGWVAESILGEKDPGRRQRIVKQIIKIADRCLELNNYNTLMALLCGLQSSTVARLQKTWSGLSKKTHETYARLLKAISHNKNYAHYRASLRQAVPPCLPFVGLYLTDLTFVDAGNASFRSRASSVCSTSDAGQGAAAAPSMLINFDKYTKTARIILELQRFQVPYPLMPLPEVQAWIDAALNNVAHGGDVNKLYRQSLLLEPRAEVPIGGLSLQASHGNALPWQHGLADPMPTPRDERPLGGFADFFLGKKMEN